MKAMVLEQVSPVESDPLRLTEVADPAPGTGQVRVKVRACAICRTDLHVIEGELPRQKLPIVPGHQVVGEVDAVGEGCSILTQGMRVGIAWLRYTCGRCAFCRSGRENLCDGQRFTGYHKSVLCLPCCLLMNSTFTVTSAKDNQNVDIIFYGRDQANGSTLFGHFIYMSPYLSQVYIGITRTTVF